MSILKQISVFFLLVVFTISFSQCSSTKHTMEVSETITIENTAQPKAYYQKWVAGVQGGGSGMDVVIHKSLVGDKKLDSVYFRNKAVALEQKNNNFIGYFKGDANHFVHEENTTSQENIIENTEDFPFNLAQNEAVISYTKGTTVKYIKLEGLLKKQSPDYPKAPQQ